MMTNAHAGTVQCGSSATWPSHCITQQNTTETVFISSYTCSFNPVVCSVLFLKLCTATVDRNHLILVRGCFKKKKKKERKKDLA